jgi:hypothetical protein
MEISQLVEQNMSVMNIMVHTDVSQFSERMYELQLYEQDEMHRIHLFEIIIIDE